MSTDLPVLSAKDFASDQDIRWCPGCGDYSILAQMKNVLASMGKKQEDITGDGDALSIGGNHFIHLIRRNVDLNIILFNNSIYGLTKGQSSPTSKVGKVTKSTPMGSIDQPLNPLSVAIAAEASFVARSVDTNIKHLRATLQRASEHRGTSFVEVYQNCNIFNDGVWDYAKAKATKDESTVELQHGKPLIYAGGTKGIKLNGFTPETVDLDGKIAQDDLLFHDEKIDSPQLAFLLSRMRHPEFPEPIGVFRAIDRPTYDTQINAQVEEAVKQKKKGDLKTLFNSGDTWKEIGRFSLGPSKVLRLRLRSWIR